MSKKPIFDDQLSLLALRQLRMRVYYSQMLLRGGLAIFGVILIWSAISAFIQFGKPDLVLFFLTHVSALLNLIVGLLIMIIGTFLFRRTYRALKINADEDIRKTKREAQSWYL